MHVQLECTQNFGQAAVSPCDSVGAHQRSSEYNADCFDVLDASEKKMHLHQIFSRRTPFEVDAFQWYRIFAGL